MQEQSASAGLLFSVPEAHKFYRKLEEGKDDDRLEKVDDLISKNPDI